MAKVGAQRAAELTGKSKSTIQRAMNAGKLSFEVDANSRRLIDVSELERVFGLQPQGHNDNSSASESSTNTASVELELERARNAIEIERLKMEVRMAQEHADNAQQQIEDLKVQRDLWQKQAQQILITSQYSQKQSEERINELQTREEARKAQADARRLQGAVQHTPRQQAQQRPQQSQVVQERPIPPQAQQGPVFRTVQPGNQNRAVVQQQPQQQKTSLFASLFGGKKARRV